MLAAALSAAALLIALFVQTMNSPLAGSWLLFLLAGCACSQVWQPKNTLWILAASWLLLLGISTFLFAPIANAGATLWILAAMPLLAISINKDNIDAHLDACLAIIIIYACGLLIQRILCMQFTLYNYSGYAWPMIDPNNASVVVGMGLLASFYSLLKTHQMKWLLPLAILCAALLETQCKAGALAVAIGCIILIASEYGQFFIYPFIIMFALICVTFKSPIMVSMQERFDIWHNAIQIFQVHPVLGTGLGSFYYYYSQISGHQDIVFAHNDVLQFAIEMGIPIALLFCFGVVVIGLKTTRKNSGSACALLVVFLQSMVEFQFYVPAISILAGVALAHHRLTAKA